MLTPSEIKEKQFKSGLGFDKKDVEQFLHEVSSDLDTITKENEDLKKKLKDMSESISYYKSIEKTLQKALVLAEKTAGDTRATAFREAEAIEIEAKLKAGMILADSQKRIQFLEHKAINLMQQYDLYKIQFENLLHAQIELINSKSFAINTDDFSYKELKDPNLNADDLYNPEELQKSLAAIACEQAATSDAQKNSEQINFDMFHDQTEEKNYKTEDGFEFYDIDKDRT